jgi:hypothetical protein
LNAATDNVADLQRQMDAEEDRARAAAGQPPLHRGTTGQGGPSVDQIMNEIQKGKPQKP